MRVTEALKLLGFIDDEWLTEESALRGTYIHELTELDDRNELAEESVDPTLAPKLEGWRKFKREKSPRFIAAEKKLSVESLDMTGTLDRFFEINGVLWLCDIKSGARKAWHRWQVALYALLWSLSTGKPAPKRCVVYLLENDYRWDQFEDRRDVERAKALITAAHIRREAA